MIRKAELTDAPAIAVLGRTTFFDAHEHSSPAADLEDYLSQKFSEESVKNELADPANIFHVHEEAGSLSGYSKIILNSATSLLPENNNVCKLERLYISKDKYGSNLGLQLFNHNKNICEQHAQSGMWLTVWVNNERAIRFYEKHGFRIIGEVLFSVGSVKNPNYVMWLEF